MSYPFKVIILDKVISFIDMLEKEDEVKFSASVTSIRYSDYKNITVKPLKNDIKELIIKKFRFIFFINKETLYFIGSFIKKTKKTPKIEIENALKFYKLITKM